MLWFRFFKLWVFRRFINACGHNNKKFRNNENTRQYNEKVIDTLIGENVLDYKEEKFDIFESKREQSNFLEWVEKYDTYDESKDKEKNGDILDYDVVE